MGLICSKQGVEIVNQNFFQINDKARATDIMSNIALWIHMLTDEKSPFFQKDHVKIVTDQNMFFVVRINNVLCNRTTTNYNRLENTVILQLSETVCKKMINYEYIVELLRTGFIFFSVCITNKVTQRTNTSTCSYPFSTQNNGIALSFYSIDKYTDFITKNSLKQDMQTSRLLIRNPVQSLPVIEHVCTVHVICSNNRSGKLLLDYITYCNGAIKDVPKFTAITLMAIPEAYFFYVRQGFQRTNDFVTYAPLFYDNANKIQYSHNSDITIHEDLQNLQDLQNVTPLDRFLNDMSFYISDSPGGGYLLMKKL